MPRIKFAESIIIERPPAVVFDYTQDYGHRLDWDTFLKRAELVGGATEAGVGVRAWCVAQNGLGMETEYVTYNRPHVTAIKMTKGPLLFTSFLGSWTFREMEAGRTEVIFLYSFTLLFPLSLAGSLVRKILRGNVRQRLLDLKHNLEIYSRPLPPWN